MFEINAKNRFFKYFFPHHEFYGLTGFFVEIRELVRTEVSESLLQRHLVSITLANSQNGSIESEQPMCKMHNTRGFRETQTIRRVHDFPFGSSIGG